MLNLSSACRLLGVLVFLVHAFPAPAALNLRHVSIDTNAPDDPWMKAMADIDGDGQLDLIVVARNGPAVWYEYPSWAKHQIAAGGWTGGTTTDVTTGDLDSDGDLDVLLANGVWFENPRPGGDPTAGPWTQNAYAPDRGHDVVVADLDNDLDSDVITRDQSATGNQILIFRNDGSGSWNKTILSAVPGGEGINLADLDRDNDLDLVLGDRWYENSGNIAAGPWTVRMYTGTANAEPDNIVAVADINQDGRLDVAVSPAESAGESFRIIWFEAPADPKTTNWIEHTIADPAESVHHSLQIADMDGDGDPDVVTAEMHQGANPDEVKIYVNMGGGLAWQKEILATTGMHNLQIGDIGDDGDIDFFGANWNSGQADDNGDIHLWENLTGGPSLSMDDWVRHSIDGELPWKAIFVAGGDLNGDELPDIVAGGGWYENPGAADGAWTLHAIGDPLHNMALLMDFDGDLDLDMLGTEGQPASDQFHWARNDGSGNFTILDNIEPADGDFLQGIAAGVFQTGQPVTIALSWHQTGRGIQQFSLPASDIAVNTWTHGEIHPTSLNEALSAGDIDGDGDLDLMQGNRWLRNNAGTWTQFTINTVADNPDRNRLADFDQDGDLDVAFGFDAETADLVWLENPGPPATGTWPLHTIAIGVGGGYSLDVADMDGDGNPDVVLGEHKGATRVLIYENNGDGSDWTPHLVDAGGVGIDHHDGTQAIDIDRDGDLDIISVGYFNEKVWLFENKAIDGIVNQPPQLDPISDRVMQSAALLVVPIAAADPEDGALTFETVGLPAFASLIDNADGTGELRFTPSEDDTGEYFITVRVIDDGAPPASDQLTFTLEVQDIVAVGLSWFALD